MLLQELLETALGSDHVYFQPPSDVEMEYPAIVYNRDTHVERFANNRKYTVVTRYQVTVISRNPDSLIPDKVSELPETSHERFFVKDGLNHDVFTIHF